MPVYYIALIDPKTSDSKAIRFFSSATLIDNKLTVIDGATEEEAYKFKDAASPLMITCFLNKYKKPNRKAHWTVLQVRDPRVDTIVVEKDGRIHEETLEDALK